MIERRVSLSPDKRRGAASTVMALMALKICEVDVSLHYAYGEILGVVLCSVADTMSRSRNFSINKPGNDGLLLAYCYDD